MLKRPNPVFIIGATSLYVPVAVPALAHVSRLNTAAKFPDWVLTGNHSITVAFSINTNGTPGDLLQGWVGHSYECPVYPWWDTVVPWSMLTTVFLTTPGVNQSWARPTDWTTQANVFHAIGAGGQGGTAVSSTGGGGGGGGAATHVNNLTLGPTTLFTVGTGGSGIATMFLDPSVLLAVTGGNGTIPTPGAPGGGLGGAAASCVPQAGAANGGAGGGGAGVGCFAASGGGGAGGPNGDGKAGGQPAYGPSGFSGAGGGGADGLASTIGSNATAGTTAPGGNGGQGPYGTGGGTGGNAGPPVTVPGAGVNGGGGGGGNGTNAASGVGGIGGAVPSFISTLGRINGGPAGGGGGSAGGGSGQVGGPGGLWGGGSGGGGTAVAGGLGGQGAIIGIYVPELYQKATMMS